MEKLNRVPVGISIEKLDNKEYEVKLYFIPDKELDGEEVYNKADKVFMRVFKTKFLIKAYFYALVIKHRYKLNFKSKFIDENVKRGS